MMIQTSQLYPANIASSPLRMNLAPGGPERHMRQRALATQVPPLVENHWQIAGPTGVLLRKVTYWRNTAALGAAGRFAKLDRE
jgi:hypothetical protein